MTFTNLLILLSVIGIVLWMAIEMYTAPYAEETEEGGFRITKEGKKLSDLFKKKNK